MTDGEMMTEADFEALVAAYGARPDRWPEDRRDAAQARARTATPRVRAALDEAHELDAMLERAALPSLSESALARLRADARPSLGARLRGLVGWRGPVWQPVGALAAALFLGIGLGLADPNGAATLASALSTETIAPDSPTDDPLGGDSL